MVSTWAKSTARIAWACAARKWLQVGPDRCGGPVDARALKDPPHRGRGDLVAEADSRTSVGSSRTAGPERFVWDCWHVPGQYTDFRTPARRFFRPDLNRRFTGA